jgi:hypothetical protein
MMEAIAPQMLRDNPALKLEFEQRLASDTAFAASPRARLDFFYERSLWYDQSLNIYPVVRCMNIDALPLIPEERWQRTSSITN